MRGAWRRRGDGVCEASFQLLVKKRRVYPHRLAESAKSND